MKRRLGLVIPTLEAVGGAERMVMALAEGLAQRGWQVTVLTLSGEIPHERRRAMRGVEAISLEMRRAWIDPRGWRRFRAWQRENPVDILHGHLAHGAWFARMAGVMGVRRMVVLDTLHSTRLGGDWTRRIYQWTRGRADCVTAVSEAVSEAARSAGIARQIRVVRNGVALGLLRRASPSDSREFVWLAVGRLEPVKDYPRLLRAFARVAERDARPMRLEIVGDGCERGRLKDLAEELRIDGRVCWRGFQEDVSGAYAGADAVVLASRWEGLPVCLMEAGATGLPVVTTATAGALEIVIPEVTGLAVPLLAENAGGDAAEDLQDSLATAMIRVMAMEAGERDAMGERAWRRVAAEFSRERMVSAYEAIYCELLERDSQTRRG